MGPCQEGQSYKNLEAVDLVSAVKELHRIPPRELGEMLRDSETFVLKYFTEKGVPFQIDVEKLARFLPLHLIAVLISSNRDESLLKYMLCGFRLLHSLCDLAARQTKFEQVLLDDVKVSEQLLDLIFHMIIVLSNCRQEDQAMGRVPLIHSALVELSGKGGVLLLAHSILKLNIGPLYIEYSTVVASVSRMKSKVLSILLLLCEVENISFLDEAFRAPRSQDLAKSVASQILELLRTALNKDTIHFRTHSDKTYPMGISQLNALRLADIFSDDSNFRSHIAVHFVSFRNPDVSLINNLFFFCLVEAYSSLP